MKQIDDDNYELSTGRQFYANCGIIGLSPDNIEDAAGLPHGYDGGIDSHEWTTAERRELGEYMIVLWAEWTRKQA